MCELYSKSVTDSCRHVPVGTIKTKSILEGAEEGRRWEIQKYWIEWKHGMPEIILVISL